MPGSSRCRGCSVSFVESGLEMNPRGPTTARATGLPSRLVTHQQQELLVAEEVLVLLGHLAANEPLACA